MEQILGSPVLQILTLFFGPFLLEEAAILAGAGLAAAEELRPITVFLTLFSGIMVSDWLLYLLGVGAGRSRWLRERVGEKNINDGRQLLARGVVAAGISARLVPWLLLPIFMASGFLGIGFFRFALTNALIALVYLGILFFGLYLFNIALFDIFAQWGWVMALLAAVAILAAVMLVRRRYSGSGDKGPAD